jgi:transcription initiation factor TFIIIB Brf1 subunit/transcription initiation factor TFIIB
MFTYGAPEITRGGCFCEVPTPFFDSMTSTDVCTTCGVVLEMVLDDSPEYGFDTEGNDISYTSNFSGTIVSFDSHNAPLAAKFQNTTMTATESRRLEMVKTVNIICDAFHIHNPSIIRECAIDLVDKLEENTKLNGKKRFASYAVAVYYACKLNHASRELRSFASTCSMDIKYLNFAVKVFKETIPGVLQKTASEHEVFLSSTIAKFSIDSASQNKLRKFSLNFINTYPQIFETGRKPRTIIAAVILIQVFNSDVPLVAKDISTVMGISHSSVAVAAKEISKMCNVPF